MQYGQQAEWRPNNFLCEVLMLSVQWSQKNMSKTIAEKNKKYIKPPTRTTALSLENGHKKTNKEKHVSQHTVLKSEQVLDLKSTSEYYTLGELNTGEPYLHLTSKENK